MSTYLKNKKHISSKLATSSKKNRKRAREPENADVDKYVYKWFKHTRDKKIPLSGLLIRAKAEQFALQLEKHNFKAMDGSMVSKKEMAVWEQTILVCGSGHRFFCACKCRK